MKRVIAVFMAVALLAGGSVLGIERNSSKFAAGFKVGLNLAKWHGKDASLIEGVIDPGFRPGGALGGFVTFAVSPQLAIQPELYYTMKGTVYEEAGDKATFKLDYLELPVLLKFTIPTRSNLAPSLFMGPAVGFKLSSKLEISSGGISAEGDVRNVQSADFGLVFGGGLDFAAGSGKFGFDIRYELGLSGLAGSDEGAVGLDYVQIDNDVDLKNSCLSFMLNYTFGNSGR